MTAYSKQNNSLINHLHENVNPNKLYKPDKTLGAPATSRASQYKLDRDTIAKDLTSDRPAYILSAYGPGRDAPSQLFGGRPREQSFEELRARHYELTAQGKQQEAIQEAQTLVNNAEQQMKTALNDLDGAIRYICNGENEHPNRIDKCKAKVQLPNQQQTTPTSQPAFGQTPSTPTFGPPTAPTAFGQPLSAPAFGQLSATSAFGKPSAPVSASGQVAGSAFGKPSTPAFGQPSAPASAFGQASTPAFGQPAALGRPTTSFGQPSSTFGQPSSQAPAFEQLSSQAPAFGQPSSMFGQPSTQASAFGQPSSQAPSLAKPSIQAPAFGQPSTQAPVFGRPSAPSSVIAPFGQRTNTQNASVFAAPSVSSRPSPFGQPTTTASTAPLSQTYTPPSKPFGDPTPPSTVGVFSRSTIAASSPSGQPPSQQQPSPFGTPVIATPISSAPTANVAATRRPSIQLTGGNFGQKDAEGKLRMWKGKEVRYIDDIPHFRENSNSEWQRIWFPDGPPPFRKTEDLPEAAYDAATKENYRFAMEHGRFGDGGIPMMPPRKEWCNWNL